MATQNVRPDPGASVRHPGQQRGRTIRRNMGVYGAVAVLVAVVALVAVRVRVDSAEGAGGQPSSSTTTRGAEGPVGTVTFDGSACSMEITADRVEPGDGLFEVVNATEKRAMFDSWELAERYTVREFAATIERDRRRPEPWIFPNEREVHYLSSEVVPAKSSDSVVTTMSPGRYAIVCMEPDEGKVMDFRPFGVVGPIVVR